MIKKNQNFLIKKQIFLISPNFPKKVIKENFRPTSKPYPSPSHRYAQKNESSMLKWQRYTGIIVCPQVST